MKTNLYIVNEIEPIEITALVKDAQLLFDDVMYTHFPIK